MGHEEQYNLSFLILNGHNVQQTPELSTCQLDKGREIFTASVTAAN